MAPKRSTSQKVKDFFTNPFRRASSTSKGRPTTSRPDPFLSQDDTRPQDVQALHDFWSRNQSANAPSTSANPSSSQRARQPRSNLPFGERMRADFRTGVDETSAALMGQPPVPHRRREREPSRAPLAPPTAAHLGASRTPLHREREPTRRVPISAPVAPANLADSASDANARNRAHERAREREREWAFHQVPEPIQNVPAHRIQLNPPTARESVHVQLSGASSSSSRETRWDDFAGPVPTAPLPPLPTAPAPPPARRNAINRRPVPPPRCQLCQAQAAVPNSNLCAYCKSVAFYPEDYPRASVYPVMSPAFSPPPVAHLKDSSYTKARQSQAQARPRSQAPRQPQPQPPARSQPQPPARSQPQPPPRSQAQPQPQPQHRTPSRTQSQLQSPTPHPSRTQPPPRRTQSRTTPHVVSPLTPHEARFRDRRSLLSPVSPILPDQDVHPALRHSSQRFAAVPDRRGALAAGERQVPGGLSRRGAVSGRGKMAAETPAVPWEGEDLWWP